MNTGAVLAVVLWVAIGAVDLLVLVWLLRWAFIARARRAAVVRRLAATVASPKAQP